MERKHDVSPTEKEMLSNIASDLLTGNHLLGRPRTLEYKRLLSEFTTAAEIANEGKRLTRRQAALLKEMETMFHDGREDMAEQLGIDLDIPFVVGVVYAVLISLLIMRDKKSYEKETRKKVAKIAKHKIFSSVGEKGKR